MRALKIAYTPGTEKYLTTTRKLVHADNTDFTDIAAALFTPDDEAVIDALDATKFGVPIFIFAEDTETISESIREKAHRIVDLNKFSIAIISNEIATAATQYEERMLPPFFEKLSEYMELNNIQFDCPGHQSGQYFRKHPAGRYMYDFYGEIIFKSDICNADVAMGDLLILEGPASEATKNAAKVYNADETLFVLNGTSTSNAVAISAVVTEGDLVLFDRNNHKSVYDSALTKCGGTPVYLQTSRNPLGFIGGIYGECFDDKYLREKAAKADPEKAKSARPFKLAVIQLGTYDGTIYNARWVVDRIGHLCDYILFDSAWVGYEQFIPMMRDCSPLLLELKPEDPGILVTQSVHKQQAGFSQASYVHKKDEHLRGQKRHVDNKRFNHAYRMNASTSPFYPLYASLDVNARMQDRESGRKLWDDCVKLGIETRKRILNECELLRPFVPETVMSRPWQDHQTNEMAHNIEYFSFDPADKWHAFDGYLYDQYFVDPNKLMLTTPGIDLETGEYEDFGIPAVILANYLRDNRIIPEKNDFNSILFLMTPAETEEKMDALVAQLVRFERLIQADASVSETLPFLYSSNIERYRGYTIRRLCSEMHNFYKSHDAKSCQKKLFLDDYMPEIALSARAANVELVRNNAKLVRIEDIRGEIALEGALPYPPGIFCVAPGERWSETAQKYFLILEEGINKFPGFSPEIHGVYIEPENGKQVAYGYVLDKADDEPA